MEERKDGLKSLLVFVAVLLGILAMLFVAMNGYAYFFVGL
jgi:hypothetical protein